MAVALHRAAAAFERATRADLQQRRWLRLHVLLLAGLTTALCWGVSALLRYAGMESLAWRPLTAVLLTWPLYLGLLWLWGRWLISDDRTSLADALDPGDAVGDAAHLAADGARAAARGLAELRRPPLSGGGGQFGGGGAQAHLDLPEPAGEAFENASEALVEVGGRAVSGSLDALGDADEGAVVVVPLLVVLGVALSLAAALGFAVFGLFGVDVLLGVAVELAFASMGGALAWRAQREGWLSHALRRTTGPMLGLAVCVGGAGLLLHHWLPQARTLPEALRLLLG
ncbi:hypothetical protein KAK06_13720 [Ideonella sp. 4Y11]|uniref:Uncharacterized protein n=1 Tax=Ideonella aquatica TaxID=2824119 RepID=A0A940YN93_9BURK|nr:hypothetical protein [Ideonella aquatica]MBQ0960007.1 hypothetical protein [Ideonella aquatica]